MEDDNAHQIEGSGGEGVDKHGSKGVPFHDIEPALGTFEPAGRWVAGANGASVALFDAPVGVADEFGSADTDDAESGQCGNEGFVAGRESETEATEDLSR